MDDALPEYEENVNRTLTDTSNGVLPLYTHSITIINPVQDALYACRVVSRFTALSNLILVKGMDILLD